MPRLLRPLILTLLLSVVPGMGVSAGGPPEVQSNLFHPQSDHAWNRLYSALWLRQAPDGKIYGQDRLDPLLWRHTRHLTEGLSVRQALKRLDEFLALRNPGLENETLKRAVMQRDLWAVFDWLANREHAGDLSSEAADWKLRRELRQKLATAIQRLALSGDEIAHLPDNYQTAVTSKDFAERFDPKHPQRPFLPRRLFDDDGPWVGLGTHDGPIAPAHVRGDNGFSRSAFSVILRLPGGREETLDYLKRLEEFEKPWVKHSEDPRLMMTNPKTPQFPPGTQVALVRRMLLIDSQGRLTPTPIVEQVQIRVYRRIEEMRPSRNQQTDPPQRFFEFALSRERLFAEKSGGLRAVGTDERDFSPIPFSKGFDELEFEPKTRSQHTTLAIPVTLRTCIHCHHEAGILSVNTYTRSFGLRGLRPPAFFETGTDRADQMGVFTKRRRYDWGLLAGLWSRDEQPTEAPGISPEKQAAAIAALKKLGGDVTTNSVGFRNAEITDDDLHHLSALTGLTKVALINCKKVTSAGLRHLKGLKNLTTLYLPYTNVGNDGLEHLKGLKKLTNLYLTGTKVGDDGLKHLKGLTSLRVLYLDSPQVTDEGLEHLKGLTKLVGLSLNDTQVTDEGLEDLKEMPHLHDLRLNNTQITDEGLDHLKKLTKLGYLFLNGTKVTDDGLKTLKGLENLEWLHLKGTKVTDRGLDHLKGLSNLENLNVSNTQVTDTGIQKLRQALPDCRIEH